MSLIEQIDKKRLPHHVAIIMDGNGRWAKAKGKDRSFGHQEGVISVRKVVEKKIHPNDITEAVVSDHLTTKGIPDPDLLIRTGGEQRISNFLLWQLSYAEFYFTEVFWPDFREEELYGAILYYQQRERRFGKTSEQLIL